MNVNKRFDVSSMISVLIGTVIGTVALIGWSIGEGNWTWGDYVVLGTGVGIGSGAVWMLFQKRW